MSRRRSSPYGMAALPLRAGPNRLREVRGKEHDDLMLPTEIAETYVHLAKQHRSTWTHEIDLRAFSDRAWWNH